MWVYDIQPLPCNNQSDRALAVQTIVSLKTSLKRQLAMYILTTGSKTLLFFVGKMRESSCSAKENIKQQFICNLYIPNFIEMLTNDVVNFQQPVPEH